MRDIICRYSVTIILSIITFLTPISIFSSESSSFEETKINTSSFIKKMFSEYNLVGVSIALVSDDKVVWEDGFGWADKKNKIKASPKTVYMLGSGSKTLMTAAILKLHEKGVIDINKPVTDYIKNFSMLERFKNQSKNLTVKRLLNHHSGLPGDIYNSAGVEKQWDKDLYIDWLLKYLSTDYPAYAPGEIAVYCNTGFVLASEILLRANSSKSTFASYMKKNLFDPLKMHNSSFNLIKENLAKGYVGGKEESAFQFNGIFGGTGGAFTTVNDMSNFLVMLLNEGKTGNDSKYIKNSTINLMGQAEKSSLDINSYFIPGLGFDSVCDLSLKYAGRTWIKDGSTGNFNSIMALLPDKKLGVIILTNTDTAGRAKYAIMRYCLKEALKEKFNLESVPEKLPDMTSETNYEKIVGFYAKGNGYDVIEVNADKDLILLKDAHSKKSKKQNLSLNKNRFSVSGNNEEIIFKNLIWNDNEYFAEIQYGSSGSKTDQLMFDNYVISITGVKFSKYMISDAWKNRLNKRYIIDNIAWNDISREQPYFSIIEKNNILMIDAHGSNKVTKPKNDNTAFVLGLTNRGDSSIRFIKDRKAFEKVSYLGYEGYDIDNVKEIEIGKSVNSSLKFHKTDWYKLKFDGLEKELNIEITSDKPDFKLRIFDSSLDNIILNKTNSAKLKLKNGIWYLAVSPSPNSSKDYTLLITEV
jgi:CubicO group peptidase (beta-lactamase class C family)